MDKTDPRVTRTRKLIEDAFRGVLQEKGFEDLSVQDVADRAGINRVTFYSHFVDRYALLRHAVREAFQAEVAARGLAEGPLSPESVRALFVAACDYVAGLHDHCRPPHDHLDWIVGEVVAEYSAGLFRQWSAARGRRAGRVKTTAEAAAAAGSSLYTLAARWSREKRRGAAETYVDRTLPIVTAVLGIGGRSPG